MTSHVSGSLVPRARTALLSRRFRSEDGGATTTGKVFGSLLGTVLGLLALGTLGGAALLLLAGGGLVFLSVALSGTGGPDGGDGTLFLLVLVAGILVLGHVAWSLRMDRCALRRGGDLPSEGSIDLLLILAVAAWTGTQLLGGLLLAGVLPFGLADRALADAPSGYAWSEGADVAVPTAYLVAIAVLIVLGVARAAAHAVRQRQHDDEAHDVADAGAAACDPVAPAGATSRTVPPEGLRPR